MLNVISLNSPYVLGMGLYIVKLLQYPVGFKVGLCFGLLLPILVAALYTFFVKKEIFSRSFKTKAAIFPIIIAVVLEELFTHNLSNVIKNFDPVGQSRISVIVILLIAIMIGCWLLNYLYITLGNKLGLLALKKIK